MAPIKIEGVEEAQKEILSPEMAMNVLMTGLSSSPTNNRRGRASTKTPSRNGASSSVSVSEERTITFGMTLKRKLSTRQSQVYAKNKSQVYTPSFILCVLLNVTF